MCNLYRMTKSASEVARLFATPVDASSNAGGGEVFPGTPGLVVAEGSVKAMTWGFPLAMKSKRTGQPLKPKPVNNARTDKLASPFWKHAFTHRRCLIPLEAFAEARGAKGAKTRTWMSLPGSELFAVAGVWRPSEEWGDCYSMVMTEACVAMGDIHDRMPVILSDAQHEAWTHGDPDEALALCGPWEGELTIDHTDQPWAGGAPRQPDLL